jgi:hypothetical protein
MNNFGNTTIIWIAGMSVWVAGVWLLGLHGI